MPFVSSAKRYSFTLNNYTEDEYSKLRGSIETHCSYAIVGREVGDSGTPHLQGYVQFHKRVKFETCKDRLNPRCHIEVSNGTPRQNRTYCRKGGDYWEHGDCPVTAGASTGRSNSRLNRDELATEFVSALDGGRQGLVGFANEFPGTYYFCRHQLLRNSLGHAQAIERPNIEVWWYYGSPGTGKSREAHERLPSAYIKEPRTKWWNGYLLEKEVIIDDFGPGGIDINHLLRWFDRYKCYVEIKGDMVPLYATTFIVTSNFHPSDLFKVKDESLSLCNYVNHPQIEALLRRIKLKEFNYFICFTPHYLPKVVYYLFPPSPRPLSMQLGRPPAQLR